MSIVKVIEVIAESDTSWEDAAKQGVEDASKSVKNIKHIYVEHIQGIVENNEVVRYRVNAKISFVVG